MTVVETTQEDSDSDGEWENVWDKKVDTEAEGKQPQAIGDRAVTTVATLDKDPSGSVGRWPTCTDEQGRTQITLQDAFGKGTHAKLRSVRRQGGQEERDLSELEGQTRKMDVEVLKAKTNAGHAASEIYSPPRIVKLLKEW